MIKISINFISKTKELGNSVVKFLRKRLFGKGLICLCVIFIIVLGVIAFTLEYPIMQLKIAGNKIKELDNYSVMTSVMLPDGVLNYLEVTTPNGNYTELPYQSTDSGYSYMLRDWLTNDNKLYEINPSYDESSTSEIGKSMWLSTPKAYGVALNGRRTMYSDLIAKGVFTSSKSEEVTMDIGKGANVNVQTYKATISSSAIKKFFMKDTYALLDSLLKEATENKNTDLISYINDNLAKLNKALTFSNGDLTYGIYDGKLVFWELETGGLGNTLTINKKLILSKLETRELPDFSSSISYYKYLDSQVKNSKKQTEIKDGGIKEGESISDTNKSDTK